MWGIALAVLLSLSWSIRERPVTVGSKKFTESIVLGEMLRLWSEANQVDAIHYRELGGTALVFQALVSGEIDAYPEYTGTISEEILSLRGNVSLDTIRERLATQGISVSEALGFNNTYAIGMLKARAEELGVRKVSDLQRFPSLAFGFSNEFMERDDGWQNLKLAYALSQRNVTGLDQDLAYRQLQAGAIDCMDVYSTDAKIKQFGLVVLEDDAQFFPKYNAVLLYRTDLRNSHPQVVSSWLRLEGAISEREMVAANAQVELTGDSEARVASEFLRSKFGVQAVQEVETLRTRLLKRTVEHIELVRRSLFPAILVAIPLGVLAARRVVLGRFVMASVSILQTIPSLALLVFLIPVMATFGFRSVGLGSSAAILALFLYALLPIVRNTYAGLINIAPHYLEAARSLGLGPWHRLVEVELPLARSSILAGIKTAAVMNVGFATLGALIGAGGYGQPILSGIRLNDTGLILEGAIPAAALALTIQFAFDLLEKVTTPRGMRV
jgi:osmoprotectant transport system permease protein